MKFTSAMLLAALLAAASVGCASSARTPAGPSQPAHPATASTSQPAELSGSTSQPVPYTLYTHCGIDEADIAGRWYEADHPLSDGNGNPPPGWGNPDQPGTITMLSATTAEFRDSLGHAVRFHLLAPGTGPKHICALHGRGARRSGRAGSPGRRSYPGGVHKTLGHALGRTVADEISRELPEAGSFTWTIRAAPA